MRYRDEDGQAIVLVALAMGIFLVGAVGLAVDGAQLYAQRQMAQSAADASALAGIMSIFDGTNGSGGAGFSTAGAFPCSTTDARTPCVYASMNGFGGTSTDTVTVEFPAGGAAPGVALSSADPVNLIRVTVERRVNTTLMRFVGSAATTTIRATATAAIVTVASPTPLLITDPANADTLALNGTSSITVCGGPSRSIEVNSSSATAYSGGGSIDLSKAGPADSGDCTAGTGADFGVFGGSAANPGSVVALGSTGHYLSKASPIQDPLANVAAPAAPATPGTSNPIANGTDGCRNASGCLEFSPGLYAGPGGLTPGNNTVIFKPGLYYVSGGGGVDFTQTVGGGTNSNAMCVGCAADPDTGEGIVIYDTGPANAQGFAASGGFKIGANAKLMLQGSSNTASNAFGQTVPAAPYYGILFWEDRNAVAQTHALGQGTGCLSLGGTVYITNSLSIMQIDSSHVQTVQYNGTPCGTAVSQGDMIVGQLRLNGNASLVLGLEPFGFLAVRQVALVD